MGIYDVPASILLAEIAKDLKTKIKQPEFTKYIKTGAHKERAPYNPDWFYTRMASILYRVYKDGQTGTGALRTYYGGRRNKGVKPEKKVKAGGKAIRLGLQLLEKEGLIKKGKKGRTITTKGEKYLFQKAKEANNIFTEQIKKQEEAKIEKAKRREELKTKKQETTTLQNKTIKEEKNDERRRSEAKKA
jgi:small subunit ribosomal protein S19e